MPEPSLGQVPKPRIQSLSDLIFGLALSIGALALINQQPTSLSQFTYSLLAFAFSFYILISVWYRYSTVMSVLPVETSGLIALNLFMLFLVSLEPYLLNLLIFQSPAYNIIGGEASLFYGLDLAGLNGILGVFMHFLAKEEKQLVRRELLKRYRFVRNFLFLITALFLFSLLPFFWTWHVNGMPVRFILWIRTVPFTLISRFFGKTR